MMYQMPTPALHRYHALDRRHSNPRCACPECASFDHSATMPMQCLPHSVSRKQDAAVLMMQTIDTETSKPQIYALPEISYANSARPSRQAPALAHERQTEGSLQAFLREVVMEKSSAVSRPIPSSGSVCPKYSFGKGTMMHALMAPETIRNLSLMLH